jgi:hypothetical protein
MCAGRCDTPSQQDVAPPAGVLAGVTLTGLFCPYIRSLLLIYYVSLPTYYVSAAHILGFFCPCIRSLLTVGLLAQTRCRIH